MKGKIVLVPFPFDDLSGAKVRPALILSDPVGPHNHVVLGFITSVIPTALEVTDILFEPSHPDFAASGLRGTSAIRLHRMMTVSTSIIIRDLGIIPVDIAVKVEEALRELFRLS